MSGKGVGNGQGKIYTKRMEGKRGNRLVMLGKGEQNYGRKGGGGAKRQWTGGRGRGSSIGQNGSPNP